jgi:arylsulfatase
MRVWAEPFTTFRLPNLFDLRADPYERADVTSNTYDDWFISQAYVVIAAPTGSAQFLETFKQFPPRQRAATFGIDQAVEKMKQSLGSQ